MSDRPSFDLAALRERMHSLQGNLTGLSDGLKSGQATGHGGGGLVRATVNGQGRLSDLHIDPSVIDPEDPQTLTHMIITAVDAAQAALHEVRAEQVSGFADGLTALAEGLGSHAEQARAKRPASPFAAPTGTAPQPPAGPAPH